MKRKLIVVLMLVLAALPLAACGKKPSVVDAPEGSTEGPGPAGTYPRTYPKPWL